MSTRIGNILRNASRNYPTASQAIQASILMTTGDIIAQTIVEKTPPKQINWQRTAQFGGLGLFLVGPTLKLWYGKLDVIISHNQVPWKRALKKVTLDQLAFAPVFTAIITSTLSGIQGMTVDQTLNRLRNDYLNIMKTNYTLWPAAQLINFSLIPLNFQVAFAQAVAIIWNTYLSMKLGNAKVSEQQLEHIVSKQ